MTPAKKVIKKLNFKKRYVEKALNKFRQFKYSTYIELYSRKLLNLSLSKQDLVLLNKIEVSTSLPEIFYLRNLVIEKQIISNNYVANRKTEHEQFFDRCRHRFTKTASARLVFRSVSSAKAAR